MTNYSTYAKRSRVSRTLLSFFVSLFCSSLAVILGHPTFRGAVPGKQWEYLFSTSCASNPTYFKWVCLC